MNSLPNYDLPFFAYGLFKPGQLCFFRIADMVDCVSETEVPGCLKERDGLPLLFHNEHSRVKGVLIHFQPGRETEAYGRIIEIEPQKVYRWDVVRTSASLEANALVGRKGGRGASDLEHCSEWDGRSDPFFTVALEEIESLAKENREFSWDYRPLLRLQMAYSLLWTALERYAGLRYHLGGDVMDKVHKISEEPAFADSLRKHVKQPRIVYSTVNLDKLTLNPQEPRKAIDYYWQVRSNSIHRGKAVTIDFDILKSSLEELLAIFKDLLNDAWSHKPLATK